MNDFEMQLKGALARKEPPAGFADRVLAQSPRKTTGARYTLPLALAAALCLAVLLWQREQHSINEERQLIFALRLTSAKLQVIHGRLQRSAPTFVVKDSL